MPQPKTAHTHYKVAAFAIENNVDFFAFTTERLRSGMYEPLTRSSIFQGPLPSDEAKIYHTFSRPIGEPASGAASASQSDYLKRVLDLIRRAIDGFLEKRADAGQWLKTVDSIVISIPGIVENGEKLIQLPLWEWELEKPVIYWNGQKGINLRLEISNIIASALGKGGLSLSVGDLKSLQKVIIVVNDATACAAYYNEVYGLTNNGNRTDFLYFKAHDGFNVGAIEQEMIFPKRPHPEYGHIYPSLHRIDTPALAGGKGFKGSCRYHGRCIEGLVSTRSFLMRAQLTSKRGKSPKGWHEALQEIKRGYSTEKEQQHELFGRLFGKGGNEPTLKHGVEIAAHYIGQAVHHMLLSPISPDHIYIGGRFGKMIVVEAVRRKVVSMFGQYPALEKFSEARLREIIQTAPEIRDVSGLPDGRRKVEVLGALVIGLARAPIQAGDNVVNLASFRRE